jgi:hypothetical protein
MKAGAIRESVGRAYDTIEMGLWASLLAFVIVFCLFIVPKIPEARARAQVQRMQDIAAENASFCKKWGMPSGADSDCQRNLQEFRQRVERRIDEDNLF